MNSPHVHVDLMFEYALDSRKISQAWRNWEYKTRYNPVWLPLPASPLWDETTQYRRKNNG